MKITGLAGLQFCGIKAYGLPDAAEVEPVGPTKVMSISLDDSGRLYIIDYFNKI